MKDLSFEETNALIADEFRRMSPSDRIYESLRTIIEFRDDGCTWRWLLYTEARANIIEILRGRGVFLQNEYPNQTSN